MGDDRCDLLCLDLEKAEALREQQPTAAAAIGASERARALADPTRFLIASALAGTDELCVCDVSWVIARAENLVSHHLRTLRASGLASSRRDGKMVLYALTPAGRSLVAAVGTQVIA
jgi:ArsR family transcriptional regulator, lead/cadmium/zinc/bismuth-responsive transcriptional repressor